MSTYADIYGHNDIKEHLQKCIEFLQYKKKEVNR